MSKTILNMNEVITKVEEAYEELRQITKVV